MASTVPTAQKPGTPRCEAIAFDAPKEERLSADDCVVVRTLCTGSQTSQWPAGRLDDGEKRFSSSSHSAMIHPRPTATMATA